MSSGCGSLKCAEYGELRGSPPVFWILLGPTDVLGADWSVVGGVGGEDLAGAVDKDGAGAAGADVDSKKHETPVIVPGRV
jgi:hypothetical protein